MSFFKEIFAGFVKPFRDFACSLLIYYLLTIKETIPSTIHNDNFSFNIWGVLLIFIAISQFSEVISEGVSTLKKGYKEPFESSLRFWGLLFGIIIFFIVFTPTYYNFGGQVGDALVFEIVLAVFSAIGILLRHYLNK